MKVLVILNEECNLEISIYIVSFSQLVLFGNCGDNLKTFNSGFAFSPSGPPSS